MDSVKTIYRNNSFQQNTRYWWRARLNLPQSSWSEPYSFFNKEADLDWYFNHSFDYSDIQFNNLAFDSTIGNWKLTNYENLLKISSAGSMMASLAQLNLTAMKNFPILITGELQLL